MTQARDAMQTRPVIRPPAELDRLLSAIREQLDPVDVWLFGSRATGRCRPDSDWDLLVVLPDDAAPEIADDPVAAWRISSGSEVPSTVLAARQSELEEIWGQVNTLGYDLAREGIRLDVG
jgi:predicted nucleotidyltransferase